VDNEIEIEIENLILLCQLCFVLSIFEIWFVKILAQAELEL
jgi:hypothetical protein